MASKTPYVVRWRNAVMDDPDLSWRAKASAMPLVRHADVNTGHNCYVGRKRAADEMSVAPGTVQKGWDELKATGYLDVLPLQEWRRKSQGAVKVMKFPRRRDGSLGEPTHDGSLGARHLAHPRSTTISGKRTSGPDGPPAEPVKLGPRCPKHPEAGELADNLYCWICGREEWERQYAPTS